MSTKVGGTSKKNQGYEVKELKGKVIVDFIYSVYSGFGVKFAEGVEKGEATGYAFYIETPDERVLVDAPEKLESSLVKSFMQEKVESARVTERNELEIYMQNGAHLSFPTHEEFEGWEVNWQGKILAVAPPGGRWLE